MQNCTLYLYLLILFSITLKKVVTLVDAQRFMTECLVAAGARTKQALQQADLLIQADKYGHPDHGLSKLEMCVNDIIKKVCMPNNEPKVLKENIATAWVDANNVLGATGGHFAMDIAIQKASKTGVGWVSVKGANYNGMVGYWAKKAADKGMLGLAFTNTSPFVAPTRSKKAALGSNPLSVAALGSDNEIFYLDMTTSVVDFDKIEKQRKLGKPLPAVWAQGPDGKVTFDAEVASKTRCLMPLGGAELTSGHKGFGLAAVVELFCGILSGSCYAHHVRNWRLDGSDEPANLGQCYIAVNPNKFAPGFEDRVTDCLEYWRKLEPTDPRLSVMCPGDREMRAACDADKRGTVLYDQKQIEATAKLAVKLKVKPMTAT